MKAEEQIKARRADIHDELCRIERQIAENNNYPFKLCTSDMRVLMNAADVLRIKLSVLDWALGRV